MCYNRDCTFLNSYMNELNNRQNAFLHKRLKNVALTVHPITAINFGTVNNLDP